jgi:hypothetical protein
LIELFELLRGSALLLQPNPRPFAQELHHALAPFALVELIDFGALFRRQVTLERFLRDERALRGETCFAVTTRFEAATRRSTRTIGSTGALGAAPLAWRRPERFADRRSELVGGKSGKALTLGFRQLRELRRRIAEEQLFHLRAQLGRQFVRRQCQHALGLRGVDHTGFLQTQELVHHAVAHFGAELVGLRSLATLREFVELPEDPLVQARAKRLRWQLADGGSLRLGFVDRRGLAVPHPSQDVVAGLQRLALLRRQALQLLESTLDRSALLGREFVPALLRRFDALLRTREAAERPARSRRTSRR